MTEYQEEKYQKEEEQSNHNASSYQKPLNLIALLSLAVTLFLAFKTFLGSSNVEEYENNKNLFYCYALACTLIYFVAAYFAQPKQSNHD